MGGGDNAPKFSTLQLFFRFMSCTSILNVFKLLVLLLLKRGRSP